MTNDVDPLKIEVTPELIRQEIPTPVAKKIDDVAWKIRFKIPADQRDPEFITKVKELLRSIITEDSTDGMIGIFVAFLPWWMAKPVAWSLDRVLPQKLLAALWLLLDKISD